MGGWGCCRGEFCPKPFGKGNGCSFGLPFFWVTLALNEAFALDFVFEWVISQAIKGAFMRKSWLIWLGLMVVSQSHGQAPLPTVIPGLSQVAPAPVQPASFQTGANPFPNAAPGESLDGNWQITALIEDGIQASEDQIRLRYANNRIFTIKGQTLSFIVPGSLEPRAILFVLDNSKTPRSIDLIGSEKTGGKGIYSLTGDTLVLCIGEPGINVRPPEFSATKGSPYLLMMLKKLPALPALAQPAPNAPPVFLEAQKPPIVTNDDQIRAMFVGTWGHQDEDYTYTYSFNRDGTFSSLKSFKHQFGKIFHEDVRSSGSWKIDQGVILSTTLTSTDKKNVNQVYANRIRTISQSEVISVDQFGKLRREWRLP